MSSLSVPIGRPRHRPPLQRQSAGWHGPGPRKRSHPRRLFPPGWNRAARAHGLVPLPPHSARLVFL